MNTFCICICIYSHTNIYTQTHTNTYLKKPKQKRASLNTYIAYYFPQLSNLRFVINLTNTGYLSAVCNRHRLFKESFVINID